MSRSPLVRALQGDDDPERAHDQLQVHPEAPVLDVAEIQRQGLVEVEVRSATALPETSQSRLDGEATGDGGNAAVELGGPARPRADDAHVAHPDVEQLRQLIQAGPAKDRSEERRG